jgi:hypothetical protein
MQSSPDMILVVTVLLKDAFKMANFSPKVFSVTNRSGTSDYCKLIQSVFVPDGVKIWCGGIALYVRILYVPSVEVTLQRSGYFLMADRFRQNLPKQSQKFKNVISARNLLLT